MYSKLKLEFGVFLGISTVVVLLTNFISCAEVQILTQISKGLCSNYRLYHNQTRKCYRNFKQGPCGQFMILRSDGSSGNPHIGKCECKAFEAPDCTETRPTIYWAETQRCYFLFDQGPCKDGEWLVATKDSAKCETNPCPTAYVSHIQSRPFDSTFDRPNATFIFRYQDSCFSTLTQGFCPDGKETYFTSDSFEPKCRYKEERCVSFASILRHKEVKCYVSYSVAATLGIACGDGTVEDWSGGCEPNAEI